MQSATAPAPSRRKDWSSEARHRRMRAAHDAPRGILPEIIVAERGGWELALDRTDAVVLDLHVMCVRQGLTRVELTGFVMPRVVEFCLRRLPAEDAPRGELIAFVWPEHRRPDPSTIGSALHRACGALRPFGLDLVSLYGGSLRLVAIDRSLA